MLSVMSYNLLADYYCSKSNDYKYCPQYALKIIYRKKLFIKEIIGYNSDIICLQEVDKYVFKFDLVPILGAKCMKGNYRMKGRASEGLATFYDTNRFELIEETGINIGSNIKTLDIFKTLWEKIQENTDLVKRFTKLKTILQVTALKSKDNCENIIVVVNIHLYYHPNAHHIRLLQMGFSLMFVTDFINKLRETMPSCFIDLVFSGDFNSAPERWVYKLMTEKSVPDNCIDWKSSKSYSIIY